MRFLRKTRGCRGMVLTEIAIVLGVVGLVAAAIWATASVVGQRQKVLENVELVTQIADNVRGTYVGFRAATPQTTTQQQINAHLFPESVVNRDRNDTINAWGGQVLLGFRANPLEGFTVGLTIPDRIPATVRRESCIDVVSRLKGSATNVQDGDAVAGAMNGLPLPAPGKVPAQAAQPGVPALTYVSAGGTWINVTRRTFSDMDAALNGNECQGVAFYFRL